MQFHVNCQIVYNVNNKLPFQAVPPIVAPPFGQNELIQRQQQQLIQQMQRFQQVQQVPRTNAAPTSQANQNGMCGFDVGYDIHSMTQ